MWQIVMAEVIKIQTQTGFLNQHVLSFPFEIGGGTSQVHFNIQQPNQSQPVSQRLAQGAGQSQSASQRLKQLGIHTSIGSRSNTPTASPVTPQGPIGVYLCEPHCRKTCLRGFLFTHKPGCTTTEEGFYYL